MQAQAAGIVYRNRTDGSTRIKQTHSKKVANEEARVLPCPDWDIRGQSAGCGVEETAKGSEDR